MPQVRLSALLGYLHSFGLGWKGYSPTRMSPLWGTTNDMGARNWQWLTQMVLDEQASMPPFPIGQRSQTHRGNDFS